MPHRPWQWIPEGSPLGQNLRKWLQSGGIQQLRIESPIRKARKKKTDFRKSERRTGHVTLNDTAVNCTALAMMIIYESTFVWTNLVDSIKTKRL